MHSFKIGQTVALVSGGPPSTVLELKADKVFVAWFDGVKDHQAWYPQAALEPYAIQIERHTRESERQARAQEAANLRTSKWINDRYFG